MNHTNILVTGGAGFIGSHLVEEILEHENVANITIIDDLSTGEVDNIPVNARIDFIEGDVTDANLLDDLFDKKNFDYIVHLAAIASVQSSFANPVRTHSVNFDATLNLLEKARYQTTIKRFIFASSAAVYGDKPELPCNETSKINPISPYGIDKYASEKFVISYSKLFGVPSTVFRFFNVYGPRQNPTSPYSGVISIFANNILNKNGEIVIFGDGEQTRDFVFVKDVVSVIIYALKSDKAIDEVFNIGAGVEISLNNLAALCSELSGKKINIKYMEERNGDIRHSVSDISKLNTIGYDKRFTDLSSGLTQLFQDKRL